MAGRVLRAVCFAVVVAQAARADGGPSDAASSRPAVQTGTEVGPLNLAGLGQDAHCRDLLRGADVQLQGNFATLVASHPVQEQVAALATCGWLGPDVDTMALTITDDAEASQRHLRGLSQRHRVIVLDAGKWPGNLEKIAGYAGLFAAMQQRGGLPARARLLLTDCCDVIFREDAPCRGEGDIFERFGRQPKRVVWGVERGSAMLMSSQAYQDRIQHGLSLAENRVPDGWLVEVRDPAMVLTGGSVQKRLRPRVFDHSAAEFAPNPLFVARGVPDVCTGLERCLHAKNLNAGLLMGDLEMLAGLYARSLELCGARCEGHNLAGSEQNVLGHYLLTSGMCGGDCGLDHNFTMFHVAYGFEADNYRVRKVAGDGDTFDLQIRLPAVRPDGVGPEGQFVASMEWVALSPKRFERTWVSVPACAVHVNGQPQPAAVGIYAKLRDGLKVEKPFLSFIQEARRSFYARRRAGMEISDSGHISGPGGRPGKMRAHER